MGRMRNRKGTEKETVSRDTNVDCKQVEIRNETKRKRHARKNAEKANKNMYGE